MKLIKLVEIHDLEYFTSSKFPTIDRIREIEFKLDQVEINLNKAQTELQENRESIKYLKRLEKKKNILMN